MTPFTLLSSARGFIAAWYWYKASAIRPIDTWETPDGRTAGQSPTAAFLQAMSASARFNKVAALWTAGAVLAGAVDHLF
jgi:hypothetical protein